ncbi:MAG: hypothetical protein A2Y38_06320 [Spirochaetes bacterium GWB1_59_5]|nr:MAG: hypothetical protein A2Y38_06320 [Spirochaetes bacterium GWB1_59_5]
MDVLFDIGRTVQFASGNFATQRAVSIEAPTYAATAATTITNAATLHIGGQPVAGTSMTLSNPYALWIESQNNAIRLTNATDAFEMRVGCAFINFLESASSVAEISVDTNDNLFVWQKVTNRQLFIRSDLSNAASAAIQFRTNGANNRWAFRTEGHFVPSSDNTYDIGDDDANSGVRNIYFASATYLGGSAGGIGITQPAISGGTRSVLTVTGGAHTALATTVEAIDVLFDIARTVQWAQGNITTQRAVQIEAPTWATATSASTFANGVNVAIDSAPNAGTNCVFTALSALRVGSADVTVGATSSGLNYATIRVPAHTATVDGTTQVTASPGIAALSLGIISINDTDNDAVTIDTGATLYIAGAPAITGGSTITLTSAYSLWVDAGDVRFDGDVRLGTAGSTTDPNVVLDADTDTGVSLAGGNEMYFITGGGRRAECTGQGLGWASGSAASPGLYALSSSGTGLYLVTTNIIGMVTGGVEGTRWNPHSIASAADATADIFSVPAQTVTVTGATGITTATGFNLSNIGIPTMSAESALTIDYSASLYISGPPTGGGAGPATITNRYALWVDSGKVRFDGAGTSSQVTAEGGVLALLASTVNGNNASSTIAIGAAVSIGVTTYTNDTATLTMTNVASLYIAGIPVASTNVTFTNPAYSLWIDAGLPRIDSTTANGTVATAMSNVGPVGSNTTIQEWLTINIGGTTRYIPCF